MEEVVLALKAGLIQNRRLQNPPRACSDSEPVAFTIRKVYGESQLGSHLTTQSVEVPTKPAVCALVGNSSTCIPCVALTDNLKLMNDGRGPADIVLIDAPQVDTGVGRVPLDVHD